MKGKTQTSIKKQVIINVITFAYIKDFQFFSFIVYIQDRIEYLTNRTFLP
jgi:hypothetical protein